MRSSMSINSVSRWLLASMVAVTCYILPVATGNAKQILYKPIAPLAPGSGSSFAISKALRDVIPQHPPLNPTEKRNNEHNEVEFPDNGYAMDGALQKDYTLAISDFEDTLVTFEGISQVQQAGVSSFLRTPPDPVGDVGRTQYVTMVNSAVQVYDKETGDPQTAVLALSNVWQNLPACAVNDGDPIVTHDQFNDRWILMAFNSSTPYVLCFAVSETEDAAGSYFLYSINFGTTFPDYPKMGIWGDTLVVTTRDFGPSFQIGVSVLAIELAPLYLGSPISFLGFFIDIANRALIGDGLLPPDTDGNNRPETDAPAFICGTQDDGGYGGPGSDGINVWELHVDWNNPGAATLQFIQTLAVDPVDTIFTCIPGSRNCIPQPNTAIKLDILSYRQCPNHRLAYRRFIEPGTDYESFVTNQAVEARAGIAGVRWYEIRRNPAGEYSVFQQGTYSPPDNLHRWMGSIAQDRKGNIALGYSVSSSTVFPSIRITGRFSGDTPGQMTIAERVIIAGTGSQTSTGSRWGDYTSMNVDPDDDCRFFYVNQYYQTTSTNSWKTRIGSFRIEGCTTDTESPTFGPTATPTTSPTATPSTLPTATPSNSPTATPSTPPTALPTPTLPLPTPPTPSTKSKAIQFIITNTGSEHHTMTKLTIEWPASNGNLLQVKRGTNRVIFDTITPPEASPFTIEDSDWLSNALTRMIGPGSSKSYTAHFDGFISPLSEEYKITATFNDGSAAGQVNPSVGLFDVSIILD